MDVRIRLAKSVVGEEESAAARRVIVENEFFGMGAEVKAFEQELQAFFQTDREVICVNTGTSALHLALEACGIGVGDEVLAPTVTFIATFQAISASGATPVPCDVRESDCWLDLEDVERRITPRTRAIMPVHYAGGPGDLRGLYELARRYNLRVIEDATHAFGSMYCGKKVGAQGDIACFSFDGIKNITAGEGGAVVTADPALAHRLREGRLLGIKLGNEKRIGNQRWDFDVIDQGWRYHMSDLFAAIGRVQLQRFEREFKPKRVHLARRYNAGLADLPQVQLLDFDYSQIAPFNYALLFSDGLRDQVRDALMSDGIECGLYYKPLHLLSRYGGGSVRLPNAERIHRNVLTLPLHPDLTDEDQDEVIEAVRSSILANELIGARR